MRPDQTTRCEGSVTAPHVLQVLPRDHVLADDGHSSPSGDGSVACPGSEGDGSAMRNGPVSRTPDRVPGKV